MTPKEKAIELVNKFKIYVDLDDPNNILSAEETIFFNAKQCALIAVDEILTIINETMVLVDIEEDYDYWIKVKHELFTYKN